MSTENRQTVSFLRRRFQQSGLEPDSRHGQNFLIDLNLLSLLVDAAAIESDDLLLEVGTGTGGLTSRLADRAGFVITVEIDERLHQLASEELLGRSNVELLRQDVLRNKNNMHPRVLEAIASKIAEPDLNRLKLVANLPYNIATPVISNLLSTPIVPASMTVTIQKELADRIVAAPSTKDYGALSVWVQSLCDVQIIRVLPPSVFWPKPKVHSAFISITPNHQKRAKIPDLDRFHEFVRKMFFHRRKFLRSNLISALKPDLDKSDVDQIMAKQGLQGTSRSEELNTDDFLALYGCVRQSAAQKQGAKM